MGNGQNRNRRGGARTRHGPHRGGAANGDRRSATQLVPPALVASAEATASAHTEVDIEANAEREDASALDTEGDSQFVRVGEPSTPAEAAEDVVMPSPAEPSADDSETVEAPITPAASEVPKAPEAPEALETQEPPEVERRAPRGRFERFYAPGQGPRAEQQTAGGAATNGATNGAGHTASHAAGHTSSHVPHPTTHASPPSTPARHVPSVLHAEASAEDDDEESGSSLDIPREDVRGAVGGLIDDLHDLFTQDRTVASQGGNSRCGICYFHFPLGELVYREAEGFYVCQRCDRSLSGARVSMVRRQQRQ